MKDGKEREIQHFISTSFWSADGKPISAEEFLNNLFGEPPKLFNSEAELRTLWSNPITWLNQIKKALQLLVRPLILLVGRPRLELGTHGLRVHCSTN